MALRWRRAVLQHLAYEGHSENLIKGLFIGDNSMDNTTQRVNIQYQNMQLVFSILDLYLKKNNKLGFIVAFILCVGGSA